LPAGVVAVPRAPPPLSGDDLQLLAGGAVVSQSPPLPGAALLTRTVLNSRPRCTLDVGFRATDALAIGRQEVIRDRLRRDHDYRAHDVDCQLKKYPVSGINIMICIFYSKKWCCPSGRANFLVIERARVRASSPTKFFY
jgi:hypothetical protein